MIEEAANLNFENFASRISDFPLRGDCPCCERVTDVALTPVSHEQKKRKEKKKKNRDRVHAHVTRDLTRVTLAGRARARARALYPVCTVHNNEEFAQTGIPTFFKQREQKQTALYGRMDKHDVCVRAGSLARSLTRSLLRVHVVGSALS